MSIYSLPVAAGVISEQCECIQQCRAHGAKRVIIVLDYMVVVITTVFLWHLLSDNSETAGVMLILISECFEGTVAHKIMCIP